MQRLENSGLTSADRKGLEDIAIAVGAHLEKHLGLPKPLAAGFLQHYGFPTELIDVSSSLEVAAFFAVWANLSGTGAITVFDTCRVTGNCRLIDLTPMSWALRPTSQHGYGIFHAQFIDLRESGIVEKIQVHRSEFRLTPEDCVRCIREAGSIYTDYVDLHDAARAVLGHLLTCMTRNDDPFSTGLAEWLARHVPPSPYTVVGLSGHPPIVEIALREELGVLCDPLCDPQALESINAVQWLMPGTGSAAS